MKEWKKLISLNLALCMVLSMFSPVTVYAEESAAQEISIEMEIEAVSEESTVEESEPSEPTTVVLQSDNMVASGECGVNLTWTLNAEGTLTISGTGAMYDCDSSSQPWREYRGSIKDVVVESGVTSVGDQAFYSISTMESVSLPNSLLAIGGWAFYGCDSLMAVSIPGTVNGLESAIFADCDKLETVTISEGITQLPASIFEDCVSLKSISLPATMTKVGTKAFLGCSALETVDFGPSITTIGANAFQDCTALSTVDLPDSLQKIETQAFRGCTNLQEVSIGSGITTIKYAAFGSCVSLGTVTIDNYEVMVSVDAEAFPTTTTIVYAEASEGEEVQRWYVGSYDETDAVATLNGDGKLVISGFGDVESFPWLDNYNTSITAVVIEDGITSIPAGSFYNCGELVTVSIGRGIETIPDSAFSHCTALISVSGMDSVQTLSASAFAYCEALETVERLEQVTYIGYHAFIGCKALDKVAFSTALSYIGMEAFCSSGLNSVSLLITNRNGVKIADYAFAHCELLETIDIEGNINSIGDEIFANCPMLTGVTWNVRDYSGLNKDSNIFLNSGHSGEGITLTIGTKVECIPEYFFYTGSAYEKQEPKLLFVVRATGALPCEVGAFAFYRCTELTYVSLGNELQYIHDGAFNGCISLNEIKLPKSLISIGSKAFYLCGLERLELGDNLQSIGANAFAECSDGFTLHGYADSYAENYANKNRIPFVSHSTSGTIDEMAWDFDRSTGVLQILGTGALTDSSCPWDPYRAMITEIQLGEGITEIGDKVFFKCDNVVQIILPSSLEILNNRAFYRCDSLASAYFLGDMPALVDESGMETTIPFYNRDNVMIYYQAKTQGWEVCSWTNCELYRFSNEVGTLTLYDNSDFSDYSETITDNIENVVNLRVFSDAAQQRYYEFASSANLIAWNSASDGSGESFALDADVAITNNMDLYGQWETVNVIIDGNYYPVGAYAEGDGWEYDGRNTLILREYEGGSIVLPHDFVVETYNENKITGAITSSYDLELYINTGSVLHIESDETAIQADQFTLYAYGAVQIVSDAECAVEATIVKLNGDEPVVISATSQAVDCAKLRINSRYKIYLDADEAAKAQASYDNGSYLRLAPKTWRLTLNANGGTWVDQIQQERTINQSMNQAVDLLKYADLIYRNGYVLDGWYDLEEDQEYAVADQFASSADLLLYAMWTEEMLIVDNEQYTPKSVCSGNGWIFVPAIGSSSATLTITDGYSGGRIYCTEDLIINIIETVSINGGTGYPAIKVLGDLTVNNSGNTIMKGGAGANGIEVQQFMHFYNDGAAAVYGGDGGAGIAADNTELHSDGQLVIVGGLRAPAVNGHLDVDDAQGIITFIGGQNSNAVSGYSLGGDSGMKYYAGSNANDVARTSEMDCLWDYPYVRVQPKTIIVTLYANGGVINGGVFATTELAQDDDNAFVLETDAAPIMSGYTFVGWNTKADGSGIAYKEGETYMTEDTVDNVTLFAQWEASGIEANYNEDFTKIVITFDDDLADTTLMLAAYTADGQMLQCAYGTQNRSNWIFDIPKYANAAEWKLFYLDSRHVATRDASFLVFQ